jgi:hypothetical protein
LHPVRRASSPETGHAGFVTSEEIPHRRFAVAGIAIAGGIVLGFVLTQTFRWAPYFWQ